MFCFLGVHEIMIPVHLTVLDTKYYWIKISFEVNYNYLSWGENSASLPPPFFLSVSKAVKEEVVLSQLLCGCKYFLPVCEGVELGRHNCKEQVSFQANGKLFSVCLKMTKNDLMGTWRNSGTLCSSLDIWIQHSCVSTSILFEVLPCCQAFSVWRITVIIWKQENPKNLV